MSWHFLDVVSTLGIDQHMRSGMKTTRICSLIYSRYSHWSASCAHPLSRPRTPDNCSRTVGEQALSSPRVAKAQFDGDRDFENSDLMRKMVAVEPDQGPDQEPDQGQGRQPNLGPSRSLGE